MRFINNAVRCRHMCVATMSDIDVYLVLETHQRVSIQCLKELQGQQGSSQYTI